jgi:L-aminopeptidase/D-esterase-like protein
MRWMEERGRGYAVGAGLVPIVPAAVVFDLAPFGRFAARPTLGMAYEACESATSRDVAEGSVGAGTGTTVGKLAGIEHAMKGGLGCGYAVADDPRIAVCAIAAVNALGDVRGADGRIIAGARAHDGGFVDAARMIARGGASAAPQRFRDVARSGDAPLDDVAGRNTTIAVVAVTTPLTRVELQGLASAATAALYRRITPCGTIFDGDVVFAVSPMTVAPDMMPDVPPPILQLEALAVEALEQAIERAVRTAKGRDGIPGLAGA